MSVVTNVLVLPGTQECDGFSDARDTEEALERYLLAVGAEQWPVAQEPDNGADGQGLHDIAHCEWGDETYEVRPGVRAKKRHPDLVVNGKGGGQAWGGSKCPECDVYAAAFNHLDWEQFKTWLEKAPWSRPEQVRVLIMGENDRAFALWLFSAEGVLTQVIDGRPW